MAYCGYDEPDEDGSYCTEDCPEDCLTDHVGET